MKLRAFTIMELIVVMLTTSIIIIAAFGLYFNIHQLLKRFFDVNNLAVDVALCDRVIRKDIIQSNGFLYQKDTLCLSYIGESSVYYFVFNDSLYRRKNAIKTLKVPCAKLEVYHVNLNAILKVDYDDRYANFKYLLNGSQFKKDK